MRRLLLFRHAKAERLQPGERDYDRILAASGRADAARLGHYIATHGLRPDHALVSPSARTVQTWETASAAFKPSPATEDERIYDASTATLFEIAAGALPGATSVMLVGHNPGLHELAIRLIAAGDIDARERLHEELPPSGLVVIDFALDAWAKLHSQSGRLERFVTPKTLDGAAN